ncbi:AAA family ATPase [Streptomyces sp. S3(2020)]|uniref:BTAD domain-containing putative transcriptional regulator n=1 Tax=Streptomyces sp. S3(2020) TaxID=2732044 RepID=UPI0014886760|nr:BTAD domain-containing putative transcriptional regulator [Streptomyces sp. S3(2020)]NNN29358.1 AAA family ATPase [Streptomyces sp. S3(2020)]
MVRLRVLGSIEADVDGVRVGLGGPRQRAVLAMLLCARGGVVSVDRMVDQLWEGSPPRRALASLQSYVSNLRRVLEPRRPRRAPCEVLVSSAPGYALRLPDEAVDAWRFEEALRRARGVSADEARRLLQEALGWWRGPAFVEVADAEWALTEVARMTELHFTAREMLIDAVIRGGRGDEAVPLAEVFTREQPLREEGWRLLATALSGAGRRADAMGALRRSRQILRHELGLEPGPELVALEQELLRGQCHQSEATALGGSAVGEGAADEALGAGRRGRTSNAFDDRVSDGGGASPTPAATPEAECGTLSPLEAPLADSVGDDLFVGRDTELTALAQAADASRYSGGVVQVTGEAGVGKTRLLGRAFQRLAREGWTVVVGRCPEFDGAPPAWAWVEALGALAQKAPPAEPAAVAALLGERAAEEAPTDAVAGRFLLHRAVATWMGQVAACGPLAVVIDDLHRGDTETLALLEYITGVDGPPVLVLTAHRPGEAGRLAGTLGQLAARSSPYRIALGGLETRDVRTLVTAVCGADVDPHTVTALAERTGGNPFYVRESARLLASEGSLVALSDVPQGVRDVLRRRLARLPRQAFEVLRLAAVVGREAHVEVLMRAAESGEADVLDGLEAGVVAGLLVEPGPGRIRFAHALVRDTLYTDLTWLRRGRAHARVAEALRDLRPDDSTALAHHCSRSGTAALAPLAVEHGLRAAELAERRYAYDAAVGMLERVVESYERIPEPGGDRDARRVELLGKLLRAQVRAGTAPAARVTRSRAIEIAEAAGRDDLLAAALTGWQVPTPWQTRPYGAVDRPVVAALERLLAEASQDAGQDASQDAGQDADQFGIAEKEPGAAVRCLLLDTLVAELSGEDDPQRVVLAARELVVVARRSGEPALLAQALASAAKCRSYERAIGFRSRIAVELRVLAERLDLPVYRWVCQFIDASVAGARNDPKALRRHAEAGLELARRYRLVESEAVHRASLAMLAQVQGDFDGALRGYDEVGALMRRHGMMHARDFHELALITVGLARGQVAELVALARDRYERNGPIDGDTYALVLARLGRLDEARTVGRIALRHDHHHTRNTCIRAELAALLGRHAEAPELIRQLLPVRDQLSGGAYTVFAMRPVAHYLGLLHRLLGEEETAHRYFARADGVARRWGAMHWTGTARRAQD